MPLCLQMVVGNEFKWALSGASTHMETVTYIGQNGQSPQLHKRAYTHMGRCGLSRLKAHRLAALAQGVFTRGRD